LSCQMHFGFDEPNSFYRPCDVDRYDAGQRPVVITASAPRFTSVYDGCPIHRIRASPDVHAVHPKPANDRNAAAEATVRRRPSS
jgi:hypothetical protein